MSIFGFGHHGHGHHDGQNPQAYPSAGGPPGGGHQLTFKIFCKADEGYCLTVRDGNVVLAPANPRDQHQHWYKDMRFSTQVKYEEGNPAFALVNAATGLAIKHSLGQSHPVKLVPFNPQVVDESVLWTESGDVGKGFRCIRMVNNTRLNFDAFHGDKDHGGVHDGTTVVLWERAKGDNQSWKILPWGDEAYAGGSNAPCGGGGGEPTVRIFCKAAEGFSVTVRNGTVCLAPTNPRDDYQHWIKDMRHSNSFRDEEGYPAFALVNTVTGEAIKHSLGEGHPVKLVPYNPNHQDESVLWTESKDVGHGFRCIRMVNNICLNFDAGDKDHGGVHDGTTVVLWEWAKGDNQSWKILSWGDEAYAGGGGEPTVRIFCKADEGLTGSPNTVGMAFLAGLMIWISEATHDPEKLPAALMSSGGVLAAEALSLVIFKAPGGIFLRLHGGAPAYSYYGILVAVMVYGLAAASFGFWAVPRDLVGWHAVGMTTVWVSVLLLVLVAALGGLTFLN